MHFDPTRRSALKQSGIALASAAASHVPGGLAGQSNRASTAHSAVLDVRTYGATGDGKTIHSPAINRAIDAAASMGGGTVIFPAGTYLSFSVRLRSHIQLRLEPGATIFAADFSVARRSHRLQWRNL
jgi:polygalacturonase